MLYVTCPDITKTVTPDLKCPASGSKLLFILGGGKKRLGGTALATVYTQLGNESTDLEDFSVLKKSMEVTQDLIYRKAKHSCWSRSF